MQYCHLLTAQHVRITSSLPNVTATSGLQRYLCLYAGYGNTYPNECWEAAWLVMVQSVLGMIMDAITIGIVFARISHPKQRGRTIAISDSAVISRRDGILKFMFRIADIRRTQVIQLSSG